MTINEFKELAGAINNCVTATGVVAGGVWALWHFVLRRERYAKIQFDLDLRVVSRAHDHLVVEVVAIVENKGIVRHWLKDFKFDLLWLAAGASVVDGDDRINRQALFEPLFKKRYWIPPDWISTFIDAGVVQRYTYLARVPKTASMLLVFAQFRYPDTRSNFHTAQKAFSLVHTEPA